MVEPTFKNYLTRVGGLALLYVASIKLTTAFLPGFEIVVIFGITIAAMIFALVEWRRE